jgi:hypothetical protein
VGFFKSLFGGRSAPRDNVSQIDIGKYLYLLDYEQRYRELLPLAPDRRLAISELYMFRGWTTQWGFRLFSPSKEIGEKVIYEVWNHAATLGRITIEAKYKIEIPDSSTVELRWQEYDEVFIQDKTSEHPIPALQLGSKAASFCGIPNNTGAIYLLATELLAHFKEIREEAIRLWS